MEITNEFSEDAGKVLKRGVLFGYVPGHLEMEGRNELWVFPLNILFSSFRNEPDGSRTMGSAVYIPDIATFTREEGKWSMIYINGHGGDSYVNITINTADLSYSGDKFVSGKWVGAGQGKIIKDENGIEKGWEMIFIHITMLGLSKGEQCKFEKVE